MIVRTAHPPRAQRVCAAEIGCVHVACGCLGIAHSLGNIPAALVGRVGRTAVAQGIDTAVVSFQVALRLPGTALHGVASVGIGQRRAY